MPNPLRTNETHVLTGICRWCNGDVPIAVPVYDTQAWEAYHLPETGGTCQVCGTWFHVSTVIDVFDALGVTAKPSALRNHESYRAHPLVYYRPDVDYVDSHYRKEPKERKVTASHKSTSELRQRPSKAARNAEHPTIRALYDQGMSVIQIANEFHTTRQSVYYSLRKTNKTTRKTTNRRRSPPRNP